MRQSGDRIDRAERRRRVGRRHLLGVPSASSIADVVAAVVALHASDPASVFLSTVARARGLDVADIERSLYDEAGVVRILGMRRTLFVVERAVAPLVHRACTVKIAAAEHRRLLKMLADAGVGGTEPDRFVERVKEDVLDALAKRGEALGRDLAADVEELQTKIVVNEGKRYGGAIGLTTQILSRMAMDGTILRTRPTGTWLSGQYRYAPMPTPLRGDDLSVAEAAAGLLRRYLETFGPATFDDCRWWTGWTVQQTRTALADVGAIGVDLDDATGFVLADDLADTAAAEPWAALLPALDPTVMGWADRGWYLGVHRGPLFDRNGNAGPTVWVDGRIVGGWGQTSSGAVAVRLLEDIGEQAASAVEARRAELATWLGDTVVKPRFATPLQREIASLP